MGAARRFVPLFAIAMGVMGIVLLITCSNVACLLLIRGVARRDEVATRAALGAGRWRILRQHITEGLMLWILGAAAGGLLVWAVTRSVAAAGLASLGIRSGQLPIDWRVVVFAGSLPLIVGILFSAIPALRAIRDDVTHALKESGGPTATRSSFAAGSVLTVVQLAASLTLLVGALLLAATLRELSRVDLGFEARGVTTAHVRPSEVGFDVNASFAFYRELLDRIAARPGVESVALAREAPFVGARTRTLIRAAGEPPEASVETATTQVLSPAYFRTLGIRLLRGHPLTADDIRQPGQEAEGGPVILSESLARRLFGTIDVVGRSVEFRRLGDLAPHEVIAVAADVRFFSLTDDPFPMVYDPRGSGLSADRATVIVRAAPTVDAASEIRQAAVAIDADVPIDIVSMSQAIQQARLEWDVLAWLMTSLAGIAIALSMIGVYGVVAFGAAARRREFGIRMAFGARPEMVRRLVLRRAAGLTIAGLALGLAGAYGLARVLENRLVGVTPFDPAIWTLAAASLIAAVVAASILPARNAARLTPADTLRVL